MAASTIAAKEVGIAYHVMPRSQVAATKPARSVVAPPPTATMQSWREKLRLPNSRQTRFADSIFFCASPFGKARICTFFAVGNLTNFRKF